MLGLRKALDRYGQRRAARRFAQIIERFEARKAEARKKHKPVRPIEAEQRAFVTACLRGRG